MKSPTVANLRIDPEQLAVFQARARRARAEFAHSVILRLLRALTPKADSRPWGVRWG